NIAEIEQGIQAIRDVCSLPIVAQMTIGNDSCTIYGDTPRTIAERLDRAGADVIGLNCSVGPDVMLDAVEEMGAVTARKISCQPNAGLPRDVAGRQMYMASPEYMGKYAKRLIHKGVKFLGGCCGTKPEHIKNIGDAGRPRPRTTASPPPRAVPSRAAARSSSSRARPTGKKAPPWSRCRWRRARTGAA